MAHPDWLHQTITVSGEAGQLADFERSAAGLGVTPWVYDYDRTEENWFLLMAAPATGERSVSIAGASILARQLREMVSEQHEEAISPVGASTACPFDLHVLAPVPTSILRLGPDDPKAMAWMWEHWGTTWSLRRVGRLPCPAGWKAGFFSADWSPGPVIRTCRERRPDLTFEVKPTYRLA